MNTRITPLEIDWIAVRPISDHLIRPLHVWQNSGEGSECKKCRLKLTGMPLTRFDGMKEFSRYQLLRMRDQLQPEAFFSTELDDESFQARIYECEERKGDIYV